MKKNLIIVALTVYAVIATVSTIQLTSDRNEWEDTGRNLLKATEAVNSYIEKTADTGEMDEFLQSPEGKMYVEHTINNNNEK